MSYLHYLCLFAIVVSNHILCCVFAVFFLVLCNLCCQFFMDCPVLISLSVFSNVNITLLTSRINNLRLSSSNKKPHEALQIAMECINFVCHLYEDQQPNSYSIIILQDI